MRIGQRSYITGIGYIHIEGEQEVELDQLTDQDAYPDGIESADALRREIYSIYQEKIKAGYKTFRIQFRMFEEAA